MDNRKFNIYFSTHTVSGIIICAILYVMFFAGSFTFFKDDITAWQKNDSQMVRNASVKKDFNYLIDSLGKKHKLKGRDFDFTIQRNHSGVYVAMSSSHDSTIKKLKNDTDKFGKNRSEAGRSTQYKPDSVKQAKASVVSDSKKDSDKERKKERRGRRGDGDSAFFTYDFSKHREVDYSSGYTMGEFLYRLHFLAQVNQVLPFRIGVPFGYLLAGMVSFIFLFALITGLLLHWDKLVSNFFTFRPWNKWKNVWTELHTVLGVIGFPYQLIFAVTGIILIFNSFLIIPYTNLFYKGKDEKIYKDLGYGVKSEFTYTYDPIHVRVNLDSLVAIVEKKWEGSELSAIAIRNYGDANMHVVVMGKPQTAKQMNGQGEWVYRVRDNKVVSERSPLSEAGYLNTFKGLIYHLHFGDYGGRPLKVIYFVLGILGCIVINSGVMIWLVARDKNNIPQHKRRFNFWTANVYLSSSLSMLPVTGFIMIVLLFLEQPEQSDIYHWYFYSWLVLAVYLMTWRNLNIVNKHTTVLSAIICIMLPVFDGVKRGNWPWITYQHRALDILFIDVLFLILGVLSFVIYLKMNQKKPASEIPKSVAKSKVVKPATAEV